MPLPKPVARKRQHSRHVTCQGFEREDGLWDIEAHLIDIKDSPLALKEHSQGLLPAGEPLHDLSLRITVDLELNILNAEASMDQTPYRICPEISTAYKHLIGVQIKPGFSAKVREMFSGTKGCTHLLEMLGPLATTAFQATHQARDRLHGWSEGEQPPPMINGCHTYDERGPVIRQYWPDAYKGD